MISALWVTEITSVSHHTQPPCFLCKSQFIISRMECLVTWYSLFPSRASIWWNLPIASFFYVDRAMNFAPLMGRTAEWLGSRWASALTSQSHLTAELSKLWNKGGHPPTLVLILHLCCAAGFLKKMPRHFCMLTSTDNTIPSASMGLASCPHKPTCPLLQGYFAVSPGMQVPHLPWVFQNFHPGWHLHLSWSSAYLKTTSK